MPSVNTSSSEIYVSLADQRLDDSAITEIFTMYALLTCYKSTSMLTDALIDWRRILVS